MAQCQILHRYIPIDELMAIVYCSMIYNKRGARINCLNHFGGWKLRWISTWTVKRSGGVLVRYTSPDLYIDNGCFDKQYKIPVMARILLDLTSNKSLNTKLDKHVKSGWRKSYEFANCDRWRKMSCDWVA